MPTPAGHDHLLTLSGKVFAGVRAVHLLLNSGPDPLTSRDPGLVSFYCDGILKTLRKPQKKLYSRYHGMSSSSNEACLGAGLGALPA